MTLCQNEEDFCVHALGWLINSSSTMRELDLGNNPSLNGALAAWDLPGITPFLQVLDVGGDSFTGTYKLLSLS